MTFTWLSPQKLIYSNSLVYEQGSYLPLTRLEPGQQFADSPWQATSNDLMGDMTNNPVVRTDYGTRFAQWILD